MGRVKQPSPLKREASNGWIDHRLEKSNGEAPNGDIKHNYDEQPNGKVAEPGAAVQEVQQAGFAELIICVGGIYGSL